MKGLLLGARGQGIVEFAVIFPLFAFLLFAVIDGGLVMGRYNVMTHAASEGARLGASGGSKSDIISRVVNQTNGLLDAPADCAGISTADEAICVDWISGPDGEAPGELGSSVRVRTRYKHELLTGGALPVFGDLGWDEWVVESCSVYRLERLPDSPVASADKNEGATGC